ncbi:MULTISPECIES: hypothetical protein [unclassified Polaribacter]|uniref:hypothetical protein n=1 Tax=unclassified Polaribacter TaxID=196858 RepID=UPI0011BFB4B9|nr:MULTISPECIES: hypothetical protein [unclassified Polaribacter]TXD50956.1 hypothetical protein ES043_13975 [Polaribacter sp. IC063]TXD57773.1 hypothetical protein ES044_14105 [Polaribacter sp. IC066]
MKNVTIYNRINIGFALTIVLLLVFATNRIDKNHFNTVQNAVTTLHTDRVVAQDFIFKMNTIVYKKQLRLIDESLVNNTLNTEFYSLIENFAETKLTYKEAEIFKRLQENFETLTASEKEVSKSTLNKKAIIHNLNIIKADLIKLSEIQISESKNLTSFAQKSLDTNNLMSNFEIGFIIFIGLLLQFTIFYRVKKSKTNVIND